MPFDHFWEKALFYVGETLLLSGTSSQGRYQGECGRLAGESRIQRAGRVHKVESFLPNAWSLPKWRFYEAKMHFGNVAGL